MENKEFEMPKVNVIRFASEDVITTSGKDDNELPPVPLGTILKQLEKAVERQLFVVRGGK